ncbi:MAG: DUF2505 domain-containing protein [Acidimicrobiales bacterium]
MRFELEQIIGAPLAVVLEAVADPVYYDALAAVSELGRPQLLECSDHGDRVLVRVRYAYVGEVSPTLGALVAAEKLTWVAECTVDRSSASVNFAVVPDHYPDRLAASGVQRLSPAGDTTRRVTEGVVRVRIPFFGRSAEQAVVDGFSRHLDAEAAFLEEWLVP